MRAKAKSSLRMVSNRARRSSAIKARRCQSSGVGGTGDSCVPDAIVLMGASEGGGMVAPPLTSH